MKGVLLAVFPIFIMLTVFFNGFAFASSPAPSPKCSIEGVIRSIEFKEAYEEPCLAQGRSCPTDTELRHPARYFLKIKVNSVTGVYEKADTVVCENMIPLSTEQIISVNQSDVKTGDSFEPGQIIKGRVSFSQGMSFDSYELDQSIVNNQSTAAKDYGVRVGALLSVIVVTIIPALILAIYFLRKKQESLAIIVAGIAVAIMGITFYFWNKSAVAIRQTDKEETIKNKEFCNQFSGSAGYMEGETKAKECIKAGCRVVNKKEFSSTQKTPFCDDLTGECIEKNMPLPDSGGYTFECVPKRD